MRSIQTELSKRRYIESADEPPELKHGAKGLHTLSIQLKGRGPMEKTIAGVAAHLNLNHDKGGQTQTFLGRSNFSYRGIVIPLPASSSVVTHVLEPIHTGNPPWRLVIIGNKLRLSARRYLSPYEKAHILTVLDSLSGGKPNFVPMPVDDPTIQDHQLLKRELQDRQYIADLRTVHKGEVIKDREFGYAPGFHAFIPRNAVSAAKRAASALGLNSFRIKRWDLLNIRAHEKMSPGLSVIEVSPSSGHWKIRILDLKSALLNGSPHPSVVKIFRNFNPQAAEQERAEILRFLDELEKARNKSYRLKRLWNRVKQVAGKQNFELADRVRSS